MCNEYYPESEQPNLEVGDLALGVCRFCRRRVSLRHRAYGRSEGWWTIYTHKNRKTGADKCRGSEDRPVKGSARVEVGRRDRF